jgi:hypothetical protein
VLRNLQASQMSAPPSMQQKVIELYSRRAAPPWWLPCRLPACETCVERIGPALAERRPDIWEPGRVAPLRRCEKPCCPTYRSEAAHSHWMSEADHSHVEALCPALLPMESWMVAGKADKGAAAKVGLPIVEFRDHKSIVGPRAPRPCGGDAEGL